MGEFKGMKANKVTDKSTEPSLYLYKQLIVVLVLGATAIVLTSPFLENGSLLWVLAGFTAWNLVNALGQAARAIDAMRKIKAVVVPRTASAPLKAMPKAAGQWSDAGEAEGACLLHVDDAPAWHHVFVIPNFKEELAVLSATLDRLASHRHASHYTILLAMEEKENNAEQKAAQLQEQYCLRFKAILFTLHSLDPATEMPGKASNVNSAVRQFSATIPPSERSRYMLTIMDADALVPPAYVMQLEVTTASVGPSAPEHVYAAPVMFEQNSHVVPSLVRVTDYSWAALAMQNLNNWTGVGFPISNYSLSLALAADIDYWDPWPDAIGEDMHLFIKAYAKTRGNAHLYPIHAPINMGHINADGFFASCVARYTQAERHMRGIADTAYVMREVVTGSMPPTWRTMMVLFGVWEAHLVSTIALIGFVFTPQLYGFLHLIGAPYYSHATERYAIDILARCNLACMAVVLISFECTRSICRRHLYGLRGPAIPCSPHGVIVHFAGYLWLLVAVWFYTVIPMLVVVIKHALNIRSTNYVVAEKKAVELDPATPTKEMVAAKEVLPVSVSALGAVGGSSSSLVSLSSSSGGARRK